MSNEDSKNDTLKETQEFLREKGELLHEMAGEAADKIGEFIRKNKTAPDDVLDQAKRYLESLPKEELKELLEEGTDDLIKKLQEIDTEELTDRLPSLEDLKEMAEKATGRHDDFLPEDKFDEVMPEDKQGTPVKDAFDQAVRYIKGLAPEDDQPSPDEAIRDNQNDITPDTPQENEDLPLPCFIGTVSKP